MIKKKLALVVLAISVPLTWTGCDSSAQRGANTQTVTQPEQEKITPLVEQRPIDMFDDGILVPLLTLETVQRDLGLSADQINKIQVNVKTAKAMEEELWTKQREIMPFRQKFSSEEHEERQRKFQPIWDEMSRKGKELSKKTLEILSPDQIKRLKQIQIQASIVAALEYPEIIKTLGISDEQEKRIRDLSDAIGSRVMSEHPPMHGATPDERRRSLINWYKASDKAFKEATESFLDVLTPEQRAKFDKLEGKKIEVERHEADRLPKNYDY
jgi:hypothetical protein